MLKWSEMGARERDALVAEKVMGWVRCGENDHTRPYHTKRTIIEEDGHKYIQRYADWDSKGPHERLESPAGDVLFFCGCEDKGDLPQYTTDITAAGEVFERAFKCPTLSREPTGKYLVWESRKLLATADSAPEAICLAALKACGVEIE